MGSERNFVCLLALAVLTSCLTAQSEPDAGGCPASCPAGTACAAGRCAPIPCGAGAPCAAPEICIGGVCADQSCDPPCSAGQACLDELCIAKAPGTCSSSVNCPSGDSCLAGFCSQPGCSPPCAAGQVCLDALCIPPSGKPGCAAPYKSCGGGAYCANLALDSSNCGACGQACPSGQVCNGTGLCAASCVVGETQCSGRCVDTLSDENDCGGCGKTCPAGQACSNGSCATTCAAPFAACGSGPGVYCADEANDPVNCGGCGVTCAAGATCVAGSCTVPCPAPFVTCSGVCTDTRYDPGNCGGCGAACPSGDYCNLGACVNPSTSGGSSSGGTSVSGSSSGGSPTVGSTSTAAGSSSGSACGGCFVVSPGSIDFGVTGQAPPPATAWCQSTPRQVTLTNACASPITVSSVSDSANPLFVTSGAPVLPFVIPAGGAPQTFEVTFEPTAAGTQAGSVSVTTAGCPNVDTVALTANAIAGAGQNTDSFTVTLVQTPVDVLWLLDIDDCGGTTGDMASAYGTIATAVIPQFFSAAAADNINFNLALTTDAPGQGGWFEPCNGGYCENAVNPYDGTSTTVFTAANSQAVNELSYLFPHFAWGPGGPPADEHTWDGFYHALCNPLVNTDLYPAGTADGVAGTVACPANLLAGPNSGFRRPGAFLAIIDFSDDNEDDWSQILAPGGVPGVGSAQAYWDFLVGVTGNPALTSFSFLADGAISGGARELQLVELAQPASGGNCGGGCPAGTVGTGCGGVLEDMVANSAWPTDIISLWANIAANGESIFPLTETPGGTITVTENGIAVPGPGANWTYDAATNSIAFATAQAPGSTILVSYGAACP